MHTINIALCFFGVLFFMFSITAQQAANNKTCFEKLKALEGSWKMARKKGFNVEVWKINSINALEGLSYKINGTDSVLLERMTLHFNKAGIYYVPTTANQNNQQPVIFTLSSAKNEVFIFENPNHDFPKRIVYHLVSADSLHAYIDDGSSQKRTNYFYKKQ